MNNIKALNEGQHTVQTRPAPEPQDTSRANTKNNPKAEATTVSQNNRPEILNPET